MISIIIPHRGNALGLWTTVTSCENDLLNSGIVYEYIFITNGETKLDADSLNIIEKAKLTKTKVIHKHFEEGVSPPEARQYGSEQASGEYLFFLDNHCMVTKDYFKRSLYDFETYDIDILHSTTQYYGGDPKCYHYNLKLKKNFWGEASATPNEAMKPYKIGVGGHGGFMVKTSAWKEVGGYGPKGLFVGYGGEEVYTDLKFWLYGKSVWLDPLILHYHYAGVRGYKRHYYDDYYKNMLGCAHLIGGQQWFDILYNSFCDSSKHIRLTSGPELTPMFDLYMQAYEHTLDHRKEIQLNSNKTLDELLVWFREQNIAIT